jgi:hypothetical protein
MKLVKNFITRLGQLTFVFCLSFISPAIIKSILYLDGNIYLQSLNSQDYCVGMSILSVIITIVFGAYLVSELDK